jgi:hypothetical protein
MLPQARDVKSTKKTPRSSGEWAAFQTFVERDTDADETWRPVTMRSVYDARWASLGSFAAKYALASLEPNAVVELAVDAASGSNGSDATNGPGRARREDATCALFVAFADLPPSDGEKTTSSSRACLATATLILIQNDTPQRLSKGSRYRLSKM